MLSGMFMISCITTPEFSKRSCSLLGLCAAHTVTAASPTHANRNDLRSIADLPDQMTGENGVDLTGTKECYVEPRRKTVLYCTGSKVPTLAFVQRGFK